MFALMREAINLEVENVRFTHRLKKHPVCLSSEGVISASMEKTLNAMESNQGAKAKMVLEINENHEIANKIKTLYDNATPTLLKDTLDRLSITPAQIEELK